MRKVDAARARVRALGAIVLGLAVLVCPSPGLRANGWEHAAIPFEALIKALDHEAEETRSRAAASLGYRGQPQAVPALLGVLDRPEPSHRVRRSVHTALGKLGDPRALPALHACLEREAREELRAGCATALATLADPRSLPILLEAFESDGHILVRSRVVDALGSFPQAESLALLTRLVSGEGNRSLRRRAIWALGRTGAPRATGPLLTALETARGESERLRIVEALGRLGDPAATGALAELLKTAESPALRTKTAIALAAVRDGSAHGVLVEMLSDELTAVRHFAVQGLKVQARPEAAAPLVALYRRLEGAVSSLGPTALVEKAPDVLSALGLQIEVLRALVELDPAAGLPVFLSGAAPREVARGSQRALKVAEGFYQRRRLALHGLGYTGSRDAAALLSGSAGLGSADPRLRAASARSLGVLGFAEAVDRLIPLLEDRSPEVRWTAAKVLGRLADRRAVAPLIARLSDGTAEVRRQAALGLGYLGDPAAREALARTAQGDPSELVRTAASYARDLLGEDG
jgi:HEAT repeat protein